MDTLEVIFSLEKVLLSELISTADDLCTYATLTVGPDRSSVTSRLVICS